MLKITLISALILILAGCNKNQYDKNIMSYEEYTTIDIAKSRAAIVILTNEDKAKARIKASEMEQNLGDYNPIALIQLALFYKYDHQLDKSFTTFALAYLRAQIDTNANLNKTTLDIAPKLVDLFFDINGNIRPTLKQQNISNQAANYVYTNYQKILELDAQTPRNYDIRWSSLSGSDFTLSKPKIDMEKVYYATGIQLEKIITQTRQQFIVKAKSL